MVPLNDTLEQIATLLRAKASWTHSEKLLVEELGSPDSLTVTAPQQSLPGAQLADTFRVRSLISKEHKASGREAWTGLEDVADGLSALRNERPYDVLIEGPTRQYTVFYTPNAIVGIASAPRSSSRPPPKEDSVDPTRR